MKTTKKTKKPEDLKEFKNLRVSVNREISKEKYINTTARFQADGVSVNDKWKILKKETGQSKQSTPQIIIENGRQCTTQLEIASALNRQYIQKVRKTLNEMETSAVNPLTHYSKVIGRDDLSFTFEKISMAQLRSILVKMKSTGSTGQDDISMRLLKQAQSELEPLLLHMVNSTISTTNFPEVLKTAKVVPIEKVGKESTSSDGWRPVNVVAALSKVIERVMLQQILQHLKSNGLVGHQHHGAVKGMSTQTLVTELQDLLVEDRNKGLESFLIALDQSRAYDIVSHEILIEKLEVIGFKPQAVKIMKSFLGERKQFVQVDGFRSESLLLGPQSVIQGSTLSCALYLIYILDLPEIFHETKHSPAEYRECKQTNAKTFIDDVYLKSYKKEGKTFKDSVLEVMEKVQEYTKANRLSLNPDKSMILLNTTNQKEKEEFEVELKGKVVKHSKEMKVLGNLLSDQLTWEAHVRRILIPALINRIRTMRIMNKYLDRGFKAIYSNSTFRSRMMFGLETWGGGLVKLSGPKFKSYKTRRLSLPSPSNINSNH